MTLVQYIEKAYSYGLVQDDESKRWYVSPLYQIFMQKDGYRLYDVTDAYDFNERTLDQMLDRECKRRNLEFEHKKDRVIEWVLNFMDGNMSDLENEKEKELVNWILKQKEKEEKSDLSDIRNISFSKK